MKKLLPIWIYPFAMTWRRNISVELAVHCCCSSKNLFFYSGINWYGKKYEILGVFDIKKHSPIWIFPFAMTWRHNITVELAVPCCCFSKNLFFYSGINWYGKKYEIFGVFDMKKRSPIWMYPFAMTWRRNITVELAVHCSFSSKRLFLYSSKNWYGKKFDMGIFFQSNGNILNLKEVLLKQKWWI